MHLRRLLTVIALLNASLNAGELEGLIALDQPRPLQSLAGYKPQTQAPIQSPDPLPAIVYLENSAGTYPVVKAGDGLKIMQRGYQFRPAMAAVQTGASVLFPNLDGEFHNVFSYSHTKRFDLGRFRQDDSSPAVTFDKPGMVKIYCEIHQHMRFILMVLDTPWFTTTDAKGRFHLSGIPAGEYILKAVLPSEKTLQAHVRIADGVSSHIELTH